MVQLAGAGSIDSVPAMWLVWALVLQFNSGVQKYNSQGITHGEALTPSAHTEASPVQEQGVLRQLPCAAHSTATASQAKPMPQKGIAVELPP